MKNEELVLAATEARKNAYAPFSKFQVGAAIQTNSGRVFVGCNVENSSYGLSICAERMAIGAMIVAGEKEIQSVVVCASPWANPCGACRQVLIEFGTEFEVIAVDASTLVEVRRAKMKDLLPDHFSLEHPQ